MGRITSRILTLRRGRTAAPGFAIRFLPARKSSPETGHRAGVLSSGATFKGAFDTLLKWQALQKKKPPAGERAAGDDFDLRGWRDRERGVNPFGVAWGMRGGPIEPSSRSGLGESVFQVAGCRFLRRRVGERTGFRLPAAFDWSPLGRELLMQQVCQYVGLFGIFGTSHLHE
jgi:hypothetical protein